MKVNSPFGFRKNVSSLVIPYSVIYRALLTCLVLDHYIAILYMDISMMKMIWMQVKINMQVE